MIKKHWVIWWLFLLATNAKAQSLANAGLPHYREINLPGVREKAGLLHQDAQGWMYLLNNKHLNRFDGAIWKSYHLPTGNFDFTAIDSYQGAIWAGTRSGQLFRTQGDSLLPFALEEGWPKSPITALASQGGHLWIATSGEGVYAYNGKRLFLFDAEDGLPDLVVSSLAADAQGVLAGTDMGLVRLQLSANQQKNCEPLSDEPLLSAVKKQGRQVWLGLQSGGLALWHNQQLSHFAHTDEDAVVRMVVLDEEVWFSDRTGHLWAFHIQQKQYQPLSFTFGGKQIRVHDMWYGSDGLVWISTQHGLLQAFPGIKRYNLPHDYDVQAVAMLPGGQVVAGTNAGSFWREHEHAPWRLVPGTERLHILSLAAEGDNSFLAGTFGQGLYRLQLGKAPRRIGPDASSFNPNIFSIEPHKDGRAWYLGTLGGLYHYHQKGGTEVVVPFYQGRGPGQYYIFQLTHDREGKLWMATDGKGVYSFSNQQFQQYNKLPKGQLRVASSLSADSSNRLWGSSPEQGLFVVEKQQMRLVPLATEEAISFVHSLNRDQLLVGLQQGLLLYQTNQNSALPLERLFSLPITQLSTNAYAPDSNGVWIGMRGGLLHLNKHWLKHMGIPKVILNKPYSIEGNEQIDQTSLDAFDNNLRFEFSIPWYFDTDLLYVRYKLHGLHESWMETDKREILLQGLAPGKYKLEVQVSFDPSFGQFTYAEHDFRIPKPFYNQWWFIFGVILLILLVSAWVIQSREDKRRLRQEAEKQSIVAQYELLKSQISPHFLFNAFNTLSALIEIDTKKASAYVDQLAVLFRKVLAYKDLDLIPLSEEMELVNAYVFLQQQRFEKRLHVAVSIDEAAKQQMVIPMSIQFLVENAVKHNVISQSKPLNIQIIAENGQITVSNNLQPKSSPEPSSGFGLSALSSRYRQQFNSDIIIHQSPTQFVVTLPLKQSLT